jgi:hypothetical protein
MDHANGAVSWVSIRPMQSINELLELFMRQAQLERAMKQPGGARVVEERELHAVRRRLAAVPESLKRDRLASR